MQADSTERGCSYPGRDWPSFVLLEANQSAEAIVAEPNRVPITGQVAGSGVREGGREGLNVKRWTTRETWNLSIMGDRFPMTNHSFLWERSKVQMVKRAFALFGEPPYTACPAHIVSGRSVLPVPYPQGRGTVV